MYNVVEAIRMSNLFKPVIYQKDIFSINYDKLSNNGIRYLLFDIDNTIAETNVRKPSKKVIKLFAELKLKGFNIVILTNAVPWRAKRFAKTLDVDVCYLACKPASFNYKKISKKYNIEYGKIAAIGDQLYTDVKGANKLGILSILVEPLAKRESFITKYNRLKEDKIIKKDKVIVRGVFYD